MQFTRSGSAVAAGFFVFAVLFRLLGPGLGAILTALPAGVMAGYLTAKIASHHQMIHTGAAAGAIAGWLVFHPTLTLPARLMVAAIAVGAVTAGGWVRVHAGGEDPVQMTGGDHRSAEEGRGRS
jgi:hypothetical protein